MFSASAGSRKYFQKLPCNPWRSVIHLVHRRLTYLGAGAWETARALAPFGSRAMPQPQQSALRNRLLKALTPGDFTRLAPHLEAVPLAMRQQLITPDQPISHASFVEEGLVSMIVDTCEGRVEIGLAGYEGFVGVPLVLGTDRTPHIAMVQAEGTALRIAALELEAALDASRALRGVLGRYVQSLIVQVGQSVYANADYNVEARLARWIPHDRRPAPHGRAAHDARVHGDDARGAPSGRDHVHAHPGGRRHDQGQARAHHRARPREAEGAGRRHLRTGRG
ncbi:protein of unknown function [Methylorubrum extorquens]|uniref:Cyclic nucleotide-binding domain-containing protein n=1 Tax=Methylorubrum extorquens TaxID=408 RepID=A0A2N9AHZ4_METEX|nr:protein of unknown function [Methylorubrum extorquens]